MDGRFRKPRKVRQSKVSRRTVGWRKVNPTRSDRRIEGASLGSRLNSHLATTRSRTFVFEPVAPRVRRRPPTALLACSSSRHRRSASDSLHLCSHRPAQRRTRDPATPSGWQASQTTRAQACVASRSTSHASPFPTKPANSRRQCRRNPLDSDFERIGKRSPGRKLPLKLSITLKVASSVIARGSALSVVECCTVENTCARTTTVAFCNADSTSSHRRPGPKYMMSI